MTEQGKKRPRSLRFGVFDPETDERVATMTLDIDNCRVIGSGAPRADGLEAAVSRALPRFEPVADVDPITQLTAVMDGAARELGLTARPIRDGDIVFDALWDSGSGMLVGRSKAFDGAEPFPPAILKGLSDSIRGAATQLSDDLAAHLVALADGPDGVAGAVAALAQARTEGVYHLDPSPRLGDVLAAIDASALEDEAARAFLESRAAIAVRLGRYERAAEDAAVLLRRWPGIPAEFVVEYRNILGIAHAKAGRTEAAIAIWQTLAYETPGIAPASRAQVLRNLAFASPPGDPRTLRWLEESVDAFLQAGTRREAAISLVYLGDAYEHHDGNRAFDLLAKADQLLDEPSLIGEALQAALHYVRAKRLAALDRKPEALVAALNSVAARRGLAGQEEELHASLALAQALAEATSDLRAADLAREAEALLREVPSERFLVGVMIDALLRAWDSELADGLRAALATTREPAARIAGETALIARDPELGSEQRLAALESLHDSAQRDGAPGGMLTPVRLALAYALRERDAAGRAVPWLERFLADAPLAEGVAAMLLEALRDEGQWSQAAAVARRELALKGETFGRLLDLADTALAADLKDEAFRAAIRARSLAGDPDQRALADALSERALAHGAAFTPGSALAVTSVTTGEFDAALCDFATRISADYRMDYWMKPEGAKDYDWVSSPERRAQVQLRTWLDAWFGGRVTIIEEIAAGAGKLDLLVQLAGGTQVILELKMCGFRYSSAYAAEGEDQVAHYMRNKGVHLGYLVVFDARLSDFGNSVLDPGEDASLTVRELHVDLRPRMEKRSRKKR